MMSFLTDTSYETPPSEATLLLDQVMVSIQNKRES